VKFTIILAWTIAYFMVILLPIDVRNTRTDAGLDMNAFWVAMFIIVVVVLTT